MSIYREFENLIYLGLGLFNFMIGLGYLSYSRFINTHEELREFQKWLSKFMIKIAYEGLYVGMIVAIFTQLTSKPIENEEYIRRIEQLEERIEILEKNN
jgi:predicted permease